MQAIVLHGKRQLTFEEMPEPQPAAGEVLIEVAACGICGSDLHGFLGYSARRMANVPLIMGHEFTGRIAALGEGVGGFAVGERVVVQPVIACGVCRACRAGMNNICPTMKLIGIERHGGFAQWVTAPAHRLFRLPDGLNDYDGAFVETLAVEVHLFRHMAPPLLRTVVVLGAGPQGLLATQLARLSGASQVIVTDLVPQRLALAERLGATATVQADREDPVQRVLEMTDRWGADFVVEAVGLSVTRQQGVLMLAPGGTLGLIGNAHDETSLRVLPIVARELHLRGSYSYTDDDFQRSLELLASGRVRVQEMIHVAPLREGVAYFRRLLDEPGSLSKVLLTPN